MKRSILIVSVLLIIVTLTLYNIYNNNDVFSQLEKARDIAVANGEDYNVAKGKNIEVLNSDVQHIMHQYTYWKTGGTYEDAVNTVAQWSAVAYQAEKAGVTVTDEEIRDYIDLQKQTSEDAANYAEFEAFVESTGMTVDEYWDSQYNLFRMEILRGKFDEYKSKSAEEKKAYMADLLKAEKLVVMR